MSEDHASLTSQRVNHEQAAANARSDGPKSFVQFIFNLVLMAAGLGAVLGIGLLLQ